MFQVAFGRSQLWVVVFHLLPYKEPWSITGSALGSTSITNTGYYNGFYQFNFTEGCQSTPVPVVATINDNTAITQQPKVSISTCVGAPVNIVVASQG